jgi:predicted negative regulator of RcsB-dependent stress response
MSHFEDEAQIEQLRRWWRENWMALAGGLGLGLAGIFGWEAWQKAQTVTAERASHLFEDLRKLPADKAGQAFELGRKLTGEFSGTPYAAQGALHLANLAVQQGDWDTARAQLEWVTRHADDSGLRKIARLRLARVLWQQGKPDEALAQLDVRDDDAFAGLYQELRGDIQLAKGDRAAARGAYEKALQLGPATAAREGLQRKLDDLAGAAS